MQEIQIPLILLYISELKNKVYSQSFTTIYVNIVTQKKMSFLKMLVISTRIRNSGKQTEIVYR